MKSSYLTYYFFTVTILFVTGMLVLPFGLRNYTPVFYMLLGPFFFMITTYSAGIKLSNYVLDKYPELMKKHAVHYGMMKGEMLNEWAVYQNRNEFFRKNDLVLTQLAGTKLRSSGLVIFSFLSLITISITASVIK